ncbi:MAG TPA: hypothetical protein VFA65_15370, partial [Bryobacteraceae bacterium]|nr:hypothetical protein [Bryobacteraceae bacterium]
FEVLEAEDQEMFDALLNQLLEEEKPACLAEVELVKKMAEHTWCSERASRLQAGCFTFTRTDEQRRNGEGEVVVHPQLELFMRYQAQHDRAYARASAELLKRRKERLLAERGFVSQRRAEAQEKRREEKHVWQAERTKTAVAREKIRLARDQVKLEREIIHKEQVKTAAAGQIKPFTPLKKEQIAA